MDIRARWVDIGVGHRGRWAEIISGGDGDRGAGGWRWGGGQSRWT